MVFLENVINDVSLYDNNYNEKMILLQNFYYLSNLKDLKFRAQKSL